MLSCYRVLDLTNEKGFLCGKALGDLGADVIKIEKPGGDPARNIGPFYHDIPDSEKSLYWFAFNANKKGITLDIETAEGQAIFKKLVRTADVVIESFHVGYMDSIGLGYDVLSEINPGLVMTSISGFGQEGPYSDYNDNDIAVWALSGYMYIMGEPDRAPLTPSYRHGHLIGAINAAVGTMIALCHRAVTGNGQQVDAATQQGLCFAISIETKVPWALQKKIVTRQGRTRERIQAKDGEVKFPFLWECKDGSVVITMGFGLANEKANTSLTQWIEADGNDPGILKRIDWKAGSWAPYTVAEVNEVVDIVSRFFKKHTKQELMKGALEWRIQLTPLLTPKDQLEFPQFKERGFWRKVDHPELGESITYPGGFVKLSAEDCGIRFRAPLIGEHNDEVFKKELGMSIAEMINLKQRRVI
jgi:crotonobetainyl-CoA:carnitine CoA-transferase CaiB-like acyl-CoA transferase